MDARPLLDDQRTRKTPYEIRRIRIANETAGIGLATFRKMAVPGITAVELAAHVESSIVVQGTLSGAARRVRAWAQVAAGRESSRLVEAFEAVNLAQERAISAAAPGVPCAEVDAAARIVMRVAGFEKEFLHATGHGTGFRYHEPHPMIAPDSRETLREGMIHSVEPGAYSVEFGGVRTEDEVVITGTGAEVLGPFDPEPG